MQKTRREAIDELLGFVGELGDSDARDVAERLLTLAVHTVWLSHPWRQFVSPTPYTFATVANQASYVLPSYFGRVSRVDGLIRNLTRGTVIWPLEVEQLQELYPSMGTSLEIAGDPRHYVLAGTQGVHTQPATSGEALEVLSSSAADVAVRALVQGLNAAGVETRTQVTLNGTTPVAIGTWASVETFSKSYPATITPTTELTSSEGTVTLRKVTGAVELMALLSDESSRELSLLTLYPKPSAIETFAAPFIRRPRPLIFDADPLPLDWWPAIREDVHIQWRVNTGELSIDSAVPRPALSRLIENDNCNRPRPRIRPFWEGW